MRSRCSAKQGIWSGTRSNASNNSNKTSSSKTYSATALACPEVVQGVAVAGGPLAHRFVPRPEERRHAFRVLGLVFAARILCSMLCTGHLVSHGAGEREQVVIPAGIGVQARQ